MSKYVITGSEGFLGSQLCQSLKNSNHEYIGIDLKSGTNICSKADIESIPLNHDDTVIHLAARQFADLPPKKNRQQFFNAVNVDGLKNILDLMLEKKCHKLIYFSTDMTYGLPLQQPIQEDHPQHPLGEYGRSKVAGEALCKEYRKKGIDITIFRPRLILGPGRLGVLKKLFKLIHHNRPVPLIGDGSNYYQMISVFDCVTAILKALEKNIPNQAYNLGSKELISTYELLNTLIKKNNSKSKLIKTNAKLVRSALKFSATLGKELLYPEQYLLADKRYSVDITKAQQQLDWAPQYSDQEMINEAYKWYLNSER